MNIRVIRTKLATSFTAGQLFIDDVYFCDTLEDRDRDLHNKQPLDVIVKNKIKGQTAIPTGHYAIDITYSQRFARLLPLICDVPGFSGVRIHPGNTAEDTEGCILVGKYNNKGVVLKSRETFNALYERIKQAKDNRENITLLITR